MKKQLLCTFTLLAFFVTSAASANHHESHHDKSGNPPDERISTLMSFGIMTVASLAIYRGGNAVGASAAAQALLHAANVLYNVGQITDKALLKDFAVRTLLAGAAAATASNPRVAGEIPKVDGKPAFDPKTQLIANVPMIGESLQAAGRYGAGVLTVTLYSLYGHAYDALRDRTPVGKFLGLS